ncbi:MAG: hypothetical protein HC932_05490 [Thermales bacterium]|nr:hypothetical protein [Thermales bacterium]
MNIVINSTSQKVIFKPNLINCIRVYKVDSNNNIIAQTFDTTFLKNREKTAKYREELMISFFNNLGIPIDFTYTLFANSLFIRVLTDQVFKISFQ